MRSSGRLRSRGHLPAVLAILLLIVPLIDCALVETTGHAHSPADTAVVLAAEIPGGALAPLDHRAARCLPDTEHCEKALPPLLAAGVPQLPALPHGVAVELSAVGALYSGGGVRGPPPPPARAGRSLLTRFCISRR
ncbi:putative copper homeostasis (lipo)protein LpqS [Nocardia otitidiscaviarum]|uniref:Uncharacterized protein n=1 Tax=Nocardia otitidiscaviarum TaxID=1823 RepID=A0A516NML7_9NOCA|nr:hypothetical protein [Nocardia otitidiscaviarum]MBF6180947.1 hypothetical protein [Nocardia otitidiscaviarum]MCP9624613.1 hypothetical protein [Nocardia otitidiscaviarum]QDP80153.1 hypothetical protein FOH10_16980 [Nocardia otitidiscaviarum]